MSQTSLPKILWLGMIKGEWPVYAFTTEGVASVWVAQDLDNRYVWRVTDMPAVRQRYVRPSTAALQDWEK